MRRSRRPSPAVAAPAGATAIAPILAALFALSGETASGQPVPWPHPDGTMHYYDAVVFPGGATWEQASDSASTLGGYLASIDSQVATWEDHDGADPAGPSALFELSARTQTMGLFRNDVGSFDGYTLFAPMQHDAAFLIDNQGRLVRQWDAPSTPGYSVYLLETGDLLRTLKMANQTFGAGAAGRVQIVDWDGAVLWDYAYSSPRHVSHHDVEPMPNGNVLLLAWEEKTYEEAIAAGRDSSLIVNGVVWSEHLVEVQPVGADSGRIVWEWHVWDHLIQDYDPDRENHGVVADHPERIDLNFTSNPGRDWLHANAVAYNEQLDQIVVSPHNFSEFWIIDHSTTTEEAAGHTGGQSGMGGDILYRWGNPQTYRAGTEQDRALFALHDPHWIAVGSPGAGNILVFDNGQVRPGERYSSIVEIETTADENGRYPLPPPGTPHGPAQPVWTYVADPPADFYSAIISGSQRQPNGSTLVMEGIQGRIFEVAPDTSIVWEYLIPVGGSGRLVQGEEINELDNPIFPGLHENMTFRAYRYAPGFPGLAGRDLTPGYPIEIYRPLDVAGAQGPLPLGPGAIRLARVAPNPVRGTTTIEYFLDRPGTVEVALHDASGRRVRTLARGAMGAGAWSLHWDGRDARGGRVASGVYFLRLRAGGAAVGSKLIVTR